MHTPTRFRGRYLRLGVVVEDRLLKLQDVRFYALDGRRISRAYVRGSVCHLGCRDPDGLGSQFSAVQQLCIA